jgi:hypothetical protein
MEGDAGEPPITVAAEPRIFGVVPPTLALALGGVGVVAGIVLALGMGQFPAGIGLLVAGAILLALAVDAARRWPTSALAQGAVGFVDGVGSRVGLARVFAGAWSEATRVVINLRRELHDLRGERERTLFELGDAAYIQDADEMGSHRDRIKQIDTRIEAAELEMEDAVAGARKRVKRERVARKPTQAIAVEETRAGGTEVHPRHRG